jgi:DDE superfamily endonuclease
VGVELEPATSGRPSSGAQQRGDPHLEAQDLAQHQKKAQTEGRTILFLDESGLTQKPHRCRTWAPRGQTPVLPFNFNWDELSVSAGLTLRNFYFRLYPDAIGEPRVTDFLQALVRHVDRRLLIVWDRLPAHRGGLRAPRWRGALDQAMQAIGRPCAPTTYFRCSPTGCS